MKLLTCKDMDFITGAADKCSCYQNNRVNAIMPDCPSLEKCQKFCCKTIGFLIVTDSWKYSNIKGPCFGV